MDHESLGIRDVEELEPPTEGLATGVSVERTRHTLLRKPVVGTLGYITNVLSIPTREPLGVDLDGAIGLEFGVFGLPETFLVNSHGKIIYKHTGPLSIEIIQKEIIPNL